MVENGTEVRLESSPDDGIDSQLVLQTSNQNFLGL